MSKLLGLERVFTMPKCIKLVIQSYILWSRSMHQYEPWRVRFVIMILYFEIVSKNIILSFQEMDGVDAIFS